MVSLEYIIVTHIFFDVIVKGSMQKFLYHTELVPHFFITFISRLFIIIFTKAFGKQKCIVSAPKKSCSGKSERKQNIGSGSVPLIREYI